jgi:hypothetical protein
MKRRCRQRASPFLDAGEDLAHTQVSNEGNQQLGSSLSTGFMATTIGYMPARLIVVSTDVLAISITVAVMLY